MSVDATPVVVGDLVTVRADLRNTGTQPQQTNGYESLAITCARWLPSVEAAPGWPVGQYLEPVIMAPGQSRTFSTTFRAQPQQVGGEATCALGLGYLRDASWATTYPWLSDRVTIEIVASPSPTTSSTTVPTTETTTP